MSSKRNIVMYREKVAPVKSRAVVQQRGTSVQDAKDHLLNGWMPVNQAYLHHIQENIRTGLYHVDPGQLLVDLKVDFSIFALALKRLPEVVGVDEVIDPGVLLNNLDEQTLARVFASSSTDGTNHDFSNMVKAQASRITHSVISSTTADILAKKSDSDPTDAYTTAVLRQLGHNLIAWNYPRIYTRALARHATGHEELEGTLTKTLGFSPNKLVSLLAEEWHLAPQIKLAIGMELTQRELTSGALDTENVVQSARKLAHLCEVGETLAQISDPEHFPTAAFKWNAVVEEVSRRLGPQGVELLSRHLDQVVGRYQRLAPALFPEKLSTEEKLERASQVHAENLLTKNSYASKCGEDLRHSLSLVYRCVIGGKVSTEALQRLVADAIPAAGFERGCLFLLDRNSGQLVATVKVGSAPLKRYRAQNSTLISEHTNALTEALYCGLPIRQDEVCLFGERVTHISGLVGNERKSGVLYLEMGEQLRNQPNEVALNRFRAIAMCLNESLGL